MVEVALALAITGLAMVSILGLFVVGLGSSHDATDDQTVSQMVQAIVADRQSTPYSQPTPTLSGTSFNIPALNAFPINGYTLFFKKNGGVLLTAIDPPYYEVNMKVNSILPSDFVFFDIRVSWPTTLSIANRTTCFYTTVFTKHE